MLTFLPFTVFVKSLLSWLSSVIQRGQIKCHVCFFFFKKVVIRIIFNTWISIFGIFPSLATYVLTDGEIVTFQA